MNFKQLMERAKAGDSAAVTELLMMYRPLLLKEAILDSNLDEDLYQDVNVNEKVSQALMKK